MPDRLQFTYNSSGVIEAMINLDGRVRCLLINPDGLPWNTGAFHEPTVRAALFQYVTSTDAEGWIGWPELEGIFRAGYVDIEVLSQRYPVTR